MPRKRASTLRGSSQKSYVTTGKQFNTKDVSVVKIIGEYLSFGYSICIKHKLIVSPPSYYETPWHNCVRCGPEDRDNLNGS